jgi:hypothetical protein
MSDEFGFIPTPVQSMRDEIQLIKRQRKVEGSSLFNILDSDTRKLVLEGPTLEYQLNTLINQFNWKKYNQSIWTPLIGMLRDLPPLKQKSVFKTQLKNFKLFTSRDYINLCTRKARESTPFIVITTMHLTLLRFRELFKLPEFLYVAVDPAPSEVVNESDYICRSFVLSRINYILHGTYLPILIDVGFFNHATSAVFLPYVRGDRVTWVRIFIDSSGLTQTELSISYKAYEDSEAIAFDKFKEWMKCQTHNTADLYKVGCVRDIQKHYGTCAHWSTLLMMFFLIHHDVADDRDLVVKWCSDLAEKTDESVIMDRFLDVFLDIRFLFTSYTYYIISTLDVPDNSSNNMPHHTATNFVSKILRPDNTEQTRNMLKVNRKLFMNALELFVKTIPMHKFNRILRESPEPDERKSAEADKKPKRRRQSSPTPPGDSWQNAIVIDVQSSPKRSPPGNSRKNAIIIED